MDKQIERRISFRFSDAAKHQIIQEFLATDCTKQEIWKKYTGRDEEHGKIILWMRHLGYNTQNSGRSPNLDGKFSLMGPKKPSKSKSELVGDDFETLHLKKRIEELEKQLKDAELKSIAFSTMIDIAEKEFNIPIRKKYNTKP